MEKKTIALVAHDSMKNDMAQWVEDNYKKLMNHTLICTGTTGRIVQQTLEANTDESKELDIRRLKSGPLGGDQQLGALIAENKIDVIIFLCDPMTSQPHDVDVKALMRIASVYNVPLALNLSTADFIINSTLFNSDYIPVIKDYTSYIERFVKK